MAREEELWPQLLPLIERLPGAAVQHLEEIIGGLSLRPDELDALRGAGLTALRR